MSQDIIDHHHPAPTTNNNADDLFSDILNLEDQYHAEGFSVGAVDGARAGRIEGRTFGLEKGFEKFAQLGRLGGRAAVWSARLDCQGEVELKGSERLRRQVERLRELCDAESVSTVNDEESVNAFDERVRDAGAKGTLISKMVGEKDGDLDFGEAGDETKGKEGASRKGGGEMEDFVGLPKGKGKE